MMDSNFQCGPQVGPREAGESHPSATAEGSPSYSGGGKNCAVGQRAAGLREHDLCKNNLDSDDTGDMATDDSAVEEDAFEARSETNNPGDEQRRTERLPDLRVVLHRLSESDFSDSMGTVPSSPTPPSISPTKYRPRRKRRGDDEPETDSDAVQSTATLPVGSHVAKRGRGKVLSAGRHIGLAKARKLLNAAITREQQLDAEEQAEQTATALRETRAAHLEATGRTPSPDVTTPKPAATVHKMAMDSLAAIFDVARKSKNLKGGFVRTLKESAENLKEAFAVLETRTTSEEVAHLRASNDQLGKELEQLRREIAQLRQKPTESPLPENSIRKLLEEASRNSIEQFGTMLNARLADIECRLLPAPILRPPLAADRKRTEVASSSSRPASKAPEATNLAAGRTSKREKRRRKKKKSLAAREAAQVSADPTPPDEALNPSMLPTQGETWSRVAQRGSKKKKEAVSAPARPSLRKRRHRGPRVPRSAAISLTLQPGAEEAGTTYAGVIVEARRHINPTSLGITEMRIRRAATGARIWQIPGTGAETAGKADALANKLREVFGPDVLRITRPMKRCDIRITGLDDAATAEEVVLAVATEGGCETGAIRAGSIGKYGSLLLSCPVEAAKKVAQKGQVRVGWTSAGVALLDSRPLRCYRCLEPGHMGSNCKTGIDRSGICYRCGKMGHLARNCSADAECAVCVAACRPAAHIIGGKGCPNHKVASKKAAKSFRAPKPTQPSQKQMDVT